MRRIFVAIAAAIIGAAGVASVQAQGAAERFGLGTFRIQGRAVTGLVLRDAFVIDLAAAMATKIRLIPHSPLFVVTPDAQRSLPVRPVTIHY